MPSSRKGKGTKKVQRRPVPIPIELARRLRTLSADRPAAAALLAKSSGEPWKKSDHSRLFKRVVKAVGLDPTEVTIYALRHTNIVRAIRANVPLRIVAVNHDTSVVMIERNYSAYIDDYTDGLTRAALLDTSQPLVAGGVAITA